MSLNNEDEKFFRLSSKERIEALALKLAAIGEAQGCSLLADASDEGREKWMRRWVKERVDYYLNRAREIKHDGKN